MFRAAPARHWARTLAYPSQPSAPSFFSSAAAATAAAAAAATVPPPDRAKYATPPPGLQRPQKHKAKKAKGHAPALPAFNSSDAASLLPVGLRAPTPRRRPADGKVIALTTAQSYDTARLLQRLQALGLLQDAVNLVGEAVLLPRWTPPAPPSSSRDDHDAAAGAGPVPNKSGTRAEAPGEVYVFESGTVVLWGLSMDAAELFLRKVIRGRSPSASHDGFVEVGRYAEPETEVLEYWGTDGQVLGPSWTRVPSDRGLTGELAICTPVLPTGPPTCPVTLYTSRPCRQRTRPRPLAPPTTAEAPLAPPPLRAKRSSSASRSRPGWPA